MLTKLSALTSAIALALSFAATAQSPQLDPPPIDPGNPDAFVFSVSPVRGYAGTVLKIKGIGLTPAVSVTVGGVTITNGIVHVGDTVIKVAIPATAQTGQVVRINRTGSSVATTQTIQVLSPIFLGVTPMVGMAGTTVTIRGRGFLGVTAVNLGRVATNFTYVSDTLVTFLVPALAINGRVVLFTPINFAATTNDFVVVAGVPSVSNLAPAQGQIGTLINVRGNHLRGATVVRFNGVESASFTISGDTLVKAAVPFGATTGPIQVITPGGSASSANNFTVIQTPFGNFRWLFAKNIGNTSAETVGASATDATGQTYIAGSFSGTMSVGGRSLVSAGGVDAFVAKLDNAGGLLWAFRFGGTGNDVAKGVAVDSNGRVHIVGYISAAASVLGTGTVAMVIPYAGLRDGFLISTDANGRVQLVKGYGSASADEEVQNVSANIRQILIGGRHRMGAFSIGGIAVTPAASTGGFAARLANTTGTAAWVLGAIASVTVRNDNTVATSAFGNASYLVAQTATGAKILSVGPTGTLLFTRTIGGTAVTNGIAAGRINVFVGGLSSGNLTSGSLTATGRGGSDGFVGIYTTAGTPVALATVGGTLNDGVTSVATDASGDLYHMGFFRGTGQLAGTTRAAVGGADLFVQKVAVASFVPQFTAVGGGTGDEIGFGLGIDGRNNAYVTGTFGGSASRFGTLRTLAASGATNLFVARFGTYSTGREGIDDGPAFSVVTAGLRLYPNPTQPNRPAMLELGALEATEVHITDLMGRQLHVIPVEGTTTKLTLPVLPAGLYVVRAGKAVARLQVQ